ncbi:hypothetical protein HGRIS_012793 [Hohenbuehelia grisea]|uniref:Replication protein A 32 kDa subunit n=1 Tax=Hohenbuehelia grisea TaxID=104357 RepID=A0ABR3ITH3_9AGAR
MSQYDNHGTNPYYSGGGGGYIQNNSPYSANASPSGTRAQDLSHSLRPVSVGQVIRATQTHTDANWVIDGNELGQVTIVGQVVHITMQATNCLYMIDDGSGRIEARYWIDASEGDANKMDGVEENMYVRVTGSIKSFGNKRYVNATHIRVCTDPHEAIFHTMEAMTASLIAERGAPPRPGQEGQRVNGSTGHPGPSGTSAYSNQQSSVSIQHFASLPAIPRRIAEFMAAEEYKRRDTPEAADGINIGAIARAIGGDAVKISAALDHLMDEGLIFTTSDENHFKLAT